MNFIKDVSKLYNGSAPDGSSIMKYITIITAMVAVTGLIWRIIIPFMLIFCLNTLFKLGIAYDFTSWLASVIFIFLVLGALKTIAPKKESK